ncbi:hypothetical protein IW261DRAFT_1427972 [Armillaria novae-zelandiae]|uniref:Uncharacterized protein n=1 Tax=Armillaria novae-zelandiae TaxID=153914 RepID=A0AA39TQA5_9AGAR|nr:hypothetical protein IW261DRAFT_1427972 [Armillaria novae-zelandiae]
MTLDKFGRHYIRVPLAERSRAAAGVRTASAVGNVKFNSLLLQSPLLTLRQALYLVRAPEVNFVIYLYPIDASNWLTDIHSSTSCLLELAHLNFDETDISSGIATCFYNAFMALSARGVSIPFASAITSIGAKQVIPETAASFSSGGFSNIFARQSFTEYKTDLLNFL